MAQTRGRASGQPPRPDERGDEDLRDDLGTDDEAFEDTEDLDEDEEADDLDEDIRDEEASAGAPDRSHTSEVGSEGGSPGDIEVERDRRPLTRGSEATTTARPKRETTFNDRPAGKGQ